MKNIEETTIMWKRVLLFSIFLFFFGTNSQAVLADTNSSQTSVNSKSVQSNQTSQKANTSATSNSKTEVSNSRVKETKTTESTISKSSSQSNTSSADKTSSNASSNNVATKTYITLNKIIQLKPRVYVNKSQVGAIYNFIGSGIHGQFSKATHQLKNYSKTSWVVTQQRYITKEDHTTALYYFVRSETGSQSGWVWHGYLKAKIVQTGGSVSKIKKIIYYRKSSAGKTYNISGPGYDLKFKATHSLKNFPNTTWYATKKMQVINKQNRKITYYYVSDSNKHAGWIWSGYLTSKVILNVKRISQKPQLPTGCEITAVTMMINYAGVKVSKMQFAKEMPRTRTGNGNKGFIGSPYSKNGAWIYPPALMKLVKKYVKSAINMTGTSFNSIKKQINKKHPVVVWLSGYGDAGTKINHAVTIIGYSSSRVYFNDPWTGKQSNMSIDSLHNFRKRDAYRAISY